MSVLLYGAPIWADAINAKQYQRTKMVSVQRKAALRCVSAYRTISTETVCVLAGECCTSSVAVKQSGRPVLISTDIMINMIGALIMNDTSLTQCEIAAHLGIAKGTVQKILKNSSQMMQVCSPWVGTTFSHQWTTSHSCSELSKDAVKVGAGTWFS